MADPTAPTDPDRPSRSPVAEDPHPAAPRHPPNTTQQPPSFAPIFTLIDNTSTRTTHHPRVRYIFSDDDPDILTHALAECDDTNNANADAASGSSAEASNNNRAMILDLATDDDGNYSVAWSSSLSPSWAVLNTQLSQISPPSSEAGNSSNAGDRDNAREGESNPNGPKSSDANTTQRRLMLRIEGIDMTAAASASSELRVSDHHRRHPPTGSGSASGSGSGSGVGSGHHQEGGEDYASMLDEFGKRMNTLRKVVKASEDRRKKVAAKAGINVEDEHPNPEVPPTSHGAETEDTPSPGQIS
ncbi:hypothetical protein F5Y16DRAFT_238646 [Xylariaceae sp. FL0255]|nr:hypothetical protein F5Y16DRAFT_238646 [Xylariaceae sp. FL0255]